MALGMVGTGRAEDPAEDDEALLQKAHAPRDGAGLCQFLRQRSVTDERRRELQRLIRDLASRRFSVRQGAVRALISQGTPALPLLREALTNPDIEVSTRAAQCVEAINRGPGPDLAAAAVRSLARRAPPEAVATLLFYLPYAENEVVAEEVASALVALCDRHGKVEPALMAALRDPLGARRGAAAYVVGCKGGSVQQAEVRRLLTDRDPAVRFQAAYGLVSGHDGRAVSVLIALLRDGSDPAACLAEEVLLRLAGDQAPGVTVREATPEARQKTAAEWEAWWRRQARVFDWSRVQVGPLGGALVAELETDVVWEAGPGGKVRWEMEDLQGPYDVQALAGGRVLVAEYTGQRVTERDRRGRVLWEYRLDSPVSCCRLPGGNTLLATTRGVMEITGRDRKLFSFNVSKEEQPVYGACKARGSGMVYIICETGLLTLDPSHKPLTAKRVPMQGEVLDVEALPEGHLLVTVKEGRDTRIVEMNEAGKTVWETRVKRASSATRLANGQVLAVSKSDRQMIQLDRAGKVVWQKGTAGRPVRVHRR
jgi:HEAT repeat protein